MARKKSRQTFEKAKREQAVKERRARKQERKEAARLAKATEAAGGEHPAGEDLLDPAAPAEEEPGEPTGEPAATD
jgi:hypothetical protein